MDLIERQAAIDALARTAREKFNLSDEFNHYLAGLMDGETAIRQLPSAQPEWNNCEGCKHLGMWENEVEYGYPSPCTRCKRRASDNYER